MSGHSKWSTIKHQKGQADARRGKVFTKLAREITVAARSGGPDPAMNSSLRLAIERARQSNMPMDNIDRAVKRASGQGGDNGASLEEVIYEGYSPGGAAIMVMALTDNRNRAASEIRKTFDRQNGKLGESGSVAWTFEHKGVITIEESLERAEEIALLAIDMGAEDFMQDDSSLEIYTTPETFEPLKEALLNQNIPTTRAEITMVPKNLCSLAPREAEQTIRLLDTLEELDDVQRVHTNGDFPTEILERYNTTS